MPVHRTHGAASAIHRISGRSCSASMAQKRVACCTEHGLRLQTPLLNATKRAHDPICIVILMHRFLHRHKSAELLTPRHNSGDLSKKQRSRSVRIPTWLRKEKRERDKEKDKDAEQRLGRSASKSRRKLGKANQPKGGGSSSSHPSRTWLFDLSPISISARRARDENARDENASSSRDISRKGSAPVGRPSRHASLQKSSYDQGGSGKSATRGSELHEQDPRRSRTVSGRIQSQPKLQGLVRTTVYYPAPVEGGNKPASQLSIGNAVIPLDERKHRYSFNAYEENGETYTSLERVQYIEDVRRPQSQDVSRTSPRLSSDFVAESLPVRRHTDKSTTSRRASARTAGMGVLGQGNPLIPVLPTVKVVIPPEKQWRNSHKNYFPLGSSEMPQSLVIRLCNAHRREVEAKRTSKAGATKLSSVSVREGLTTPDHHDYRQHVLH